MTGNINAEDVLAYAFLTRVRHTNGDVSSPTESATFEHPEEGLHLVRAFSSIKSQKLRLAAAKFVATLARLEDPASTSGA